MDRQLNLDLESRQEREERLETYLRPLGLARREVLVLRLLAGLGERLEAKGQQASRMAIGKSKAGKLLGVSPNTFVAGACDLELRGLLYVIRASSPWIYLVNWSRLARLEPPPEPRLQASNLFDDSWEPGQAGKSVSVGQRWSASVSAPETVNTDIQETQPSPEIRDRVWAAAAGPAMLATSDQELRSLEAGVLRAMFKDCLEQEWLANTPEDRTKFLAICHHAATSPGIHHPARVARAAIRQYNFSRVGQRSWDWAAERLRSPDRDAVRRPLAEAEVRKSSRFS